MIDWIVDWTFNTAETGVSLIIAWFGLRAIGIRVTYEDAKPIWKWRRSPS